MASYASRLLSAARRRGVLAAIAAACCVLGCAWLPAAPADAKHVKAVSAPVASSEATTAPQSKSAEREAKAEGSGASQSPAAAAAPVEQPPESAAVGHKRRGRPSRRPAKSQAGEAPAGVASGPRSASRGGAGAGKPSHKATGPRSSSTSASAQEPTQSGETSAQRSAALARQKKGSGRKGKAGKTVTSALRQGTARGASNAQVSAGQSSEPSAVATAAAVGTTATSSVVAPAAATTASAAGVHARRVARRTRHRVAKKPAGRRVAAGPPSTATLLLPTVASATTPARAPRAAAKKTPAPTSQPALVKTITRIVGVVPTAVWMLIAALVALALALGVRSRLAARRTRRLERQRGQLLEDVGLLQAALLPVPPMRLGPVGTTAAYRPADGPGAGGDFYDVFALEGGQLAVIIGDVSGHGREALPHTALLRFTVRAYLEAGLPPRKSLQTAGTVLERQLGDSFATVLAATYHPRRRTFTYASAGHPPPIVIPQPATAGDARSIKPVTAGSAPPIGAGMRTGTRQTVIAVPGPAQLCFYTDGVTEARVGTDLFGDARLAAALAALGRGASAATLLDSVAEQTDARPDDMAACLLRVEGGAGAPAILVEEFELDRDTAASARTERFLIACGVQPAELAEIMHEARAQAERFDTVLLELRFDGAAPVVSMHHDNVVHTAELAAASVS
jgi:serine phosphatase RsbU (regulator of sigma subunit)